MAQICTPPTPLVQAENWQKFVEWARDGGYDQSFFNRWDSKSQALQELYLEEQKSMTD